MATSLSTTIKNSIEWVQVETLSDGTTVQDGNRLLASVALANGTAASQSDKIYRATRTLAATTNDDLDLAGGLTVSVFGGSIATDFVKITAIYIYNKNTTAGDKLLIGPNATGTPLTNSCLTPFNSVNTSVLTLGPNGVLALSSPVDGLAVTASTGDLLRIRNPGSNSITYDIVIVGRSA